MHSTKRFASAISPAAIAAARENLDEAERLYARALALKEHLLGTSHPDVAVTLSNLASVHEDQGRLVDAERLLARAVAIFEHALAPGHPKLEPVARTTRSPAPSPHAGGN